MWVATYGGGVSVLDPDTGAFRHHRHRPDDPRTLPTDLDDGDLPGALGRHLGRHRRRRCPALRRGVRDASWVTATTRSTRLAEPGRRAHVLPGPAGSALDRNLPGRGEPAAPAASPVRVLHARPQGPQEPGQRHGRVVPGGRAGTPVGGNGRRLAASLRRAPARLRPLSAAGDSVRRVSRCTRIAAGGFGSAPIAAAWPRFDPESGASTTYVHRPGDPTTITNDEVWAIAEDEAGSLWLGTNYGLDRFDPATGRVTAHYDTPRAEDRRDNAGVRALLFDRAGNLWVGDLSGLRFLPRGGERLERVRPQDIGLRATTASSPCTRTPGDDLAGDVRGGPQAARADDRRVRDLQGLRQQRRFTA